ncbi:MAG: hypothetical protein HZA53_05075, partial [Planctomycetes bacterium]|nr:hypothetical protein [Planctomycetota bacterium]
MPLCSFLTRLGLACLGLVFASDPLHAQEPAAPEAPRVLGRTPPSERTDPADRGLLEGLRWLVRHQQADGSWSARLLANRCDADACCADPKATYHALYEPGLTALAVLAFEECGYGPAAQQNLVDTVRGKRARIGDVVERGLLWLQGLQKADGSVTPEKAFSYDEALAALAFTEAYELTHDDGWRACAQRSVDWLVRAQRPSPSGAGPWGWRYQSLEDVRARVGGDTTAVERELHDADTSITAWAARALGRAKRAGLVVPDPSIEGALAFTRWATARDGMVGYIDPKGAGATVTGKNDHFEYHPAVMSALGMSTRMELAPNRAEPFFALAAARLAEDRPRATKDGLSVDYYYWHAGTRALFEWGGRADANAAW